MTTITNEEGDDLTSNNNHKIVSPQSPTGSTTLRSIVERLEPSIVNSEGSHQPSKEVIEVRKTPFGNVRVVSDTREANEGEIHESKPLGITVSTPNPIFFDQERIACISGTSRFPIKQRTKYGRAELWQTGKIVYHHSQSQCTITIDCKGSNAVLLNSSNIPLIDPILFKKLYTLASSWFTRFRQCLTIAQVIIPSNKIFASLICQIRANGPDPDFEIHFGSHGNVSGLSENIYVRISRQRNRLVYNTKIGQQNNKDGKAWAWRYGSIPLVSRELISSKIVNRKWSLNLSGMQGSSEMLSDHEYYAIQEAIKVTEKVDNIFKISFDTQHHIA